MGFFNGKNHADEPGSNPPCKAKTLVHLCTVDISLVHLLQTELLEAKANGWRVVTVSGPGENAERLKQMGFEHHVISSLGRGKPGISDARAAAQLFRLWRQLQPSVVHTHTPKAGVLGRITSRLAGVPIVVNTCHGLTATEHSSALTRTAVCFAEGLASRFSDAELFQNPEDLSTLGPWMKRRFRKKQLPQVSVVGNGTDLTAFCFDETDRARVRLECGVADGEVLIVGVGRRVAEKGILEFAEAAESLKRANANAQFVWVGPEEPGKADAVPMRPVNLSGAVLELGGRSDMRAVYSAADVFVLPSHREGFPRSAMEAAACGRPLVLTDIRGCREIGVDGRDLLFVRLKDSSDLAAKIARLVDSPELRGNLGEAALRRAHEAFDQRKTASKSRNAYQKVGRSKNIVAN